MGNEIFLVTDKEVYEGNYYKGHLDSPKLNNLVFRLHQVQRVTGAIVHIIRMAGTRMKHSGINGLLCGDLMEGIMAGVHPLKFLSYDLGADKRSQGLISKWVKSWWRCQGNCRNFSDQPLKLLTLVDWFTLYEIKQPRLWCPPPGAMETVVELFTDNQLIHPNIPHVFCVPHLMIHLWQKALSKDGNLMFTVAVGNSIWPKFTHKPLIVLVVLPLFFVTHYRGPWMLRGLVLSNKHKTELKAGFKASARNRPQELHDVTSPLPNVWDLREQGNRDLLQQFLVKAGNFPCVSDVVVQEMLPTVSGRPISGTKNAIQRGGGGGQNRQKTQS